MKLPVGPTARNAELVTECFDDGLVVYDQRSDAAHSLRPDVAAVWRLCDGSATPQQIASRLALDPELVECALFQLEVCDLLEPAEGAESEGFDFARIDRRGMLKRTAAISGGVALISSVLVPSAFAFGSGVTFTATGTVGSSMTAAATNNVTLQYLSGGANAYCDIHGHVTSGSAPTGQGGYIQFGYGNSGGTPIMNVENMLTAGNVMVTISQSPTAVTTSSYTLSPNGTTGTINLAPGDTLTVTMS